jgi:hypothetical protein
MNKLFDALLIIDHFGWKNDLDPKFKPFFDKVYDYAANLSDSDLTKEDLAVVSLIDRILEEKFQARDAKDFNNN